MQYFKYSGNIVLGFEGQNKSCVDMSPSLFFLSDAVKSRWGGTSQKISSLILGEEDWGQLLNYTPGGFTVSEKKIRC